MHINMKGKRDADIPYPHLGVPSIPDEFKLLLDWKAAALSSRNNNIWLRFDIFQQGIPKEKQRKQRMLFWHIPVPHSPK